MIIINEHIKQMWLITVEIIKKWEFLRINLFILLLKKFSMRIVDERADPNKKNSLHDHIATGVLKRQINVQGASCAWDTRYISNFLLSGRQSTISPHCLLLNSSFRQIGRSNWWMWKKLLQCSIIHCV